MKSAICCLVLLSLAAASAAGDSPLAKPLRQYDRNKDGKLTGEEVVLARQAFNRGGRELEEDGPSQEAADRRKGDWKQQQKKFLDGNGDGKLDATEHRRGDAIWTEIAAAYDQIRTEILRKYDRNDDGELNPQERSASRAEFESRRKEIGKKVMAAHSPAKPAGPGA